MKKILLILSGIIVLGIAYYAISPLFRNVEVNDALPEPVVVIEEIEQKDQVLSEDIKEEQASAYEVVGTAGHPASGIVRIINTKEGSVVRYEDFMTINGPRLNVYLSKDLEAKDFIDLGPIKGTKGNINYEIPKDVNLSEYKYIMYWCVPFGVLFNYAELR